MTRGTANCSELGNGQYVGVRTRSGEGDVRDFHFQMLPSVGWFRRGKKKKSRAEVMR